MKKYICHGDYVISKNDGDKHYINARRVAELYKVNLEDCVFIELGERLPRINNPDCVYLFPQYSGNYDLYQIPPPLLPRD